MEWVAKRTNEFGNFGSAVGIGIVRDRKIIAGVVYNEYNGVNMNMHVAAEPKSRWLDRSALAAFFGYPFKYVNRVTGLIGERNYESRRLCEGVGFTLECELEAAHPTGKLLVYRMFKRDCRWIPVEVTYEKRAA